MSKKVKDKVLKLSEEEYSSLRERVKRSNLGGKDIETILTILETFANLKQLLAKRSTRLLSLLRKLFGVKTEKSADTDTDKNDSKPKNKGPGRSGRNGRNDYPGAPKTEVSHPELSPGDQCPECETGKLQDGEPAVDYDWRGSAPIHLEIFLLQRLICTICKATFTAPSPVAETAKTVDDSGDSVKTARCDRNAMANAVVACLRYMFGIPFYRLAKIQGKMGIGLPESTQYQMVQQVFESAVPVYLELIARAADATLIMADDTTMKILDWLAGKGPPNKTNGQGLKRAQSTAIVAKMAEGQSIVLYLTDEKQAGRHVEALLEKRSTDSGVPIYMCDGLAANKVGDDRLVVLCHCLDHARRKFYDIKSTYASECGYVLDELKLVYKTDKEAKEMALAPDQRLEHHKKYSGPVMERLGKWMQDGLKQGYVEENSELGGAIAYCLERWTELNEFLHTPGIPLSNAECEQKIKLIITHRKNSLFYKSARGAYVGDVIQSLIATCHESNTNCFQYLEWLQMNKADVAKNPGDYLPWMFSN